MEQHTGVDSTGGLGRISAAKRRFVNDDDVGARLAEKGETRDDEMAGAAIAATPGGFKTRMSEKEENERKKHVHLGRSPGPSTRSCRYPGAHEEARAAHFPSPEADAKTRVTWRA